MLLNGLELLIKNYDFKGYTISDVGRISGLAAMIIMFRNQQVSKSTPPTPREAVKDRLGITEEEEEAGLGSKR